MTQALAERCGLNGHYKVRCVGPRTVEEGQRISDFVEQNPYFISTFKDQVNVIVAEYLNIDLVEKWDDEIHNTVMTEGVDLMLDTALAGSSYTVTGPYMGLISSVSYTATAQGDTAAQINGTNQWKEAGSSTNYPLYTTPRKTCVFSSASARAKALSAALSFAIITTGGTIEGAFVIYGSGASSTIANTSGTLLSAGVFSGGTRAVNPGDTVNVSYSLGIT
jgi:hypothetical protein